MANPTDDRSERAPKGALNGARDRANGAVRGAPADRGRERGLLITFEGGDGVGKSTHIRFLARELAAHGVEVVRLREPGGTPVGERLRSILLNPKNDIADESELLLYEAARAQLVARVVEPALERGAVVLCDRFTDSTLAYQGFGRGLDTDLIERLNAFACRGIAPDRTILLLADDADAALSRAKGKGEGDRIEQAGGDFHARVAGAFAHIAERDPARVRAIVSRPRRSETAKIVFFELADLFPWMAEGDYATGRAFARLDRTYRRPSHGGKGGSSHGGHRGGGSRRSHRPRAGASGGAAARGGE